jgi:hypothetical protein
MMNRWNGIIWNEGGSQVKYAHTVNDAASKPHIWEDLIMM